MVTEEIINRVIRREGGFVNNKNDFGGPTNMGITLNTLNQWRGRPVTVQELKDLHRDEAFKIYYHLYVTEPKFDQIPDLTLRELVIDSGVLFGQVRVARWVQEAIGVRADGIFGPVTLTKLKHSDAYETRISVLKRRLARIGFLVSHNYKQRRSNETSRDVSVFAEGWINRSLEFL